MKTKAVSGDETGLLTALSAAPPEAVAALGAGESSASKIALECTLSKEKESRDKDVFDCFCFFFPGIVVVVAPAWLALLQQQKTSTSSLFSFLQTVRDGASSSRHDELSRTIMSE